jgi:hypothetical protein
LLAEDYDATKFNLGAFKILNCAGQGAFPAADTDAVYDGGDTVVTGTFFDAKSGVTYTASQLIQEYWQGPLNKYQTPPSWCVPPSALRTGATGNDFGYLYPQSTWLSFDSTYDKNLAGQSVPRNTFAGWDKMDANTVLKLNTNTGVKDTAQIPYDLSIHVHQATFASLMQAIVASGITCLEFSTVNTDGTRAPWADFLEAGAFASFMPGLLSLYPADTTLAVRISPYLTPHVRVGMGRLSYMPRERLRDPAGGPLPINNERYTLGIALPDVRIDIVKDGKNPVTLMTMYWSTTAGFIMKAVRACYKLDPLYGQNECTSTQVNERSVSGYNEFFVDLNSDSIGRDFENGRDGFGVGQFTNRDIGTTRGESSFVITQTVCDIMPQRCNKLGLSQAIPMLANSLIQMFFVARFTFMNFTLDTLYRGPEGPNDDLVGGGDYLGIYARMIGDLDVFGLIQQISGGSGGGLSLAPGLMDQKVLPMATVPAIADDTFIATNAPTFDVAVARALVPGEGENSYSYQIDDGFWHSPVADPKLSVQGLLEGKHKIALKAFTDTERGAFGQIVPTVLTFTVDTVAPEVKIHPAEHGFFRDSVRFSATDLQAGADQLTFEYAWDGGAFRPADDTTLSLGKLDDGRHTLRVRATDLAGNVGTAAREIVIEDSGWGCASAGRGDASWLLVAAALAVLGYRRRRA